jgi:hypothetical protein
MSLDISHMGPLSNKKLRADIQVQSGADGGSSIRGTHKWTAIGGNLDGQPDIVLVDELYLVNSEINGLISSAASRSAS